MSAGGKRKSYLSVHEERLNLVEHFEQVQNRIEELIKYSKGLVALLKRRVQVDKEHVKSVQKLVVAVHEESQFKGITFDGVLEAQWISVREHLQAEAMHLSSVSSTLERRALQPLQTFLIADLEKRFRNVTHDGRRVVKDYLNAGVSLQKAKEKYHSCTAEWEGSLLVLYREFGDTWSPTTGNKLHEREQLLSRKVQEARSEYEVIVSHVNSLQHDVFLTQLPTVLNSLRSIATNMVAVVNNALKSFSEMQTILVSGSGTEKPAIPPEQFNAAEYTKEVVFGGVATDSIPPPAAYEFEEFLFKDESLMVQARKVQYECLSKLSPQELVTRGHQFFAGGDQRKSNAHTPGDNSRRKGVNGFLVRVCVEYLGQEVALKEEGLFRVPGDSSIVRSLHNDFLSGRATREFLRRAVLDQRDPNNVSSLLKRHLREHSLLGEESSDLTRKALEAGDVDALLDSLMEGLQSEELELLTKIVAMLTKLVQEPWKNKNKMTPRTLGIACGLSIFPLLEPGQAANLLEFLIKSNDRLQESHSQL